MDAASPFHSGEQQVQERLGVRDIEHWARKVVRDYLPEPHRAFHTALPFPVAAARDSHGRPWATLLVGDDGFVTSRLKTNSAGDEWSGHDERNHEDQTARCRPTQRSTFRSAGAKPLSSRITGKASFGLSCRSSYLVRHIDHR